VIGGAAHVSRENLEEFRQLNWGTQAWGTDAFREDRERRSARKEDYGKGIGAKTPIFKICILHEIAANKGSGGPRIIENIHTRRIRPPSTVTTHGLGMLFVKQGGGNWAVCRPSPQRQKIQGEGRIRYGVFTNNAGGARDRGMFNLADFETTAQRGGEKV